LTFRLLTAEDRRKSTDLSEACQRGESYHRSGASSSWIPAARSEGQTYV